MFFYFLTGLFIYFGLFKLTTVPNGNIFSAELSRDVLLNHARRFRCCARDRKHFVQDVIFTIGALGLVCSNKSLGVYLIKINTRT